jgi:succinoglycan biosynthesis transport protein ExoP
MAALIARGGKRVLLMDLDFHNPTQTRTLAPNATGGLLELVARASFIENAIWTDPDTGMAFLPLVTDPDSPNSTDILSSDAMEALLTTLRARYDYVIVDLPPLAPMVDVRATSHLIDSYILVVEWGRTRIDAVQRILSRAHGVRENIIGAVLNKVELNTIGRYDPDIIKYYYDKYDRAG